MSPDEKAGPGEDRSHESTTAEGAMVSELDAAGESLLDESSYSKDEEADEEE